VLTLDVKPNGDGFAKAGELVRVRNAHRLTLQDGRIFNRLVEHAGSKLVESIPHRIKLRDLRGRTHKGGERVRDSLMRLMETVVEVPWRDSRGRDAILRTPILATTVSTIDEADLESELTYAFSDGLREILKRSQYWARIKSSVCFAMPSKYALRLYEAVALRVNLRDSEAFFSVKEFRDALSVEPGKLEAYPDLRRKVITPAVAGVNEKSPFMVEVEPVRIGGSERGRLAGFTVRWRKKDAGELAAVGLGFTHGS
jgi:Initiator Replication protein